MKYSLDGHRCTEWPVLIDDERSAVKNHLSI